MSERQLRPITNDQVPGFPFADIPPDVLGPNRLCYSELLTCITDVLDGVTPTPAPTPPPTPRNNNMQNMQNMQQSNPNVSIRLASAGNMMIRNGNMMMMMNNANPLNPNSNTRKLLVRNERRNARDPNSFADGNTYSYEDINEIDDYGSGRRRLGTIDEYVESEEDREKVRSNNCS